MSIESSIESLIRAGLTLDHFEILNESRMHGGHRRDTHFKVVAVSEGFENKRLIQRHQLIYALVNELMNNPIHALSMHLYTPVEWAEKSGVVPASPKCMGGSKHDK